ncbi:hypothetical protein Hanom_Chr08g00726221 [Helianthus anomalus]
MATYRQSLKGSIVISLLQARLKMAHKTKALGFECPSWNVDAWETKLKTLGGHPVEHPVKSAAADSPKAMEKLPGTGEKTEKDI